MTDKYNIDDIKGRFSFSEYYNRIDDIKGRFSISEYHNRNFVDVEETLCLMNQAYEEGRKYQSDLDIGEYNNLKSIAADFKQENEKLKEENEKDLSDLMRLQGNLIKLTSDYNHLESENQELKSVLMENTRALADTVKENEKLKEKLSDWENHGKRILYNPQETKEIIDSLTKENERLKINKIILTPEASDAILLNCHEKIDELEKELIVAQKEAGDNADLYQDLGVQMDKTIVELEKENEQLKEDFKIIKEKQETCLHNAMFYFQQCRVLEIQAENMRKCMRDYSIEANNIIARRFHDWMNLPDSELD